MSTLLEERPVTRDPEVTVRVVTEPTRHGGGGGGRRSLLGTAGLGALAIVILLILGAITGLVDLGGIFEGGTTTTSSKVLLKQMKNLSAYTAAEGQYMLDVTDHHNVPVLPDFVAGSTTTLRAVGTVAASVDFSGLATEAVQVTTPPSDGSGGAVSITLPAPTLGKAVIDPDQSAILNRDRGIAERIGDIFQSNPTNDSPLYKKAAKKIEKAAHEAKLADRAKANTERMLKGFLLRLGFDQVTVSWQAPPARTASRK